MASIYRRGRVWWLHFMQDGRQQRVSLKTQRREVAEQFLKEYEARTLLGYQPVVFAPPKTLDALSAHPDKDGVEREQAFQDYLRSQEGHEWAEEQTRIQAELEAPPPARTRIKEFVARYFHHLQYVQEAKRNTIVAKQTALKVFGRWARSKSVKFLDEITDELVFAFRQFCDQKYPARATVFAYFKELATIWEYGVRSGEVTENLFRKYRPKAPATVRKRFLSEPEIKRLLNVLASFPMNLQLAVRIALFTGMRYSEIVALKWD